VTKKKMPAVPDTLDKYLEGYSHHMVGEVFRFLKARSDEQGLTFANALSKAFVKAYIGAILFDALKRTAESTAGQAEQADKVITHFAQVKAEIQEAIALGFQDAMQGFTRQPVEYYCQVNPIPEMKSKTVN
jgi:hypothetical protein